MNFIRAKYSNLSITRNRVSLYLFIILLCVMIGFVYGLFLPLLPTSQIKFLMVPILILSLFGIWMIPEREQFLEDKTRYTFYAFLFFWCLWPPYLSLITLPGDPWMSPQRILIYVILIFALLMFSVSKNAKRTLKDNYKENKVIFIALMLLMFSSGISIFFSSEIDHSVTAFLKDSVFNFLVFFIAATIINNEKRLKIIFQICIFSAIVLGLMSYYESILSQTIWSYHLPRSMFDNSEITQSILTSKLRFGVHRVKGSSLTSLEYAELLSYVIPMCLYYLIDKKGMWLKPIMLITIIVIFHAIIVSQSRLGLVGAIVSMTNYSYIMALRKWRLDQKSLLGPALLTLYPACLISFIFLLGFSTRLSNKVFGTEGHAGSTQARPEMWVKGIPLIFDRPIFGHGIGMGAEVLDFRNYQGGITIDTYILSIILETGLVGGIAFIAIFLLGSIKASRAYTHAPKDDEFGKMAAAIASILLAFLIIKIVLSQDYNHTLLFMLLGIVTHFRYADATGQSKSKQEA